MAGTVTIANVELGGQGVQQWEGGGDTARLTGTFKGTTATHAGVVAYQVKGILENPDEQAVPFIASSAPLLTGFYRVTGGSIEQTPEMYRSFWFNYTLELERVPGVASPVIESRLVGALRSNAHSITTASMVQWWATPTDAVMDRVASVSTASRTGEGSSVRLNYVSGSLVMVDATPTWQCAAGDYYDMAARVEVTYDGNTWLRLPGRQIGIAVAASNTGWRINNGFVRVTYGGGNGLLSVQHYSAAAGAWLTAKIYALTIGVSPSTPVAMGAIQTITILRNAPEEVTVRLGLDQSTANPVQVYCDLRLRRGALWVEGVVSRAATAVSATESASTEVSFGIQRNTAEAGSTHTSGVHATAADAGTGGGKYILTSPTATNVDTTQGGITQGTGPAPDKFQFMVGYEPPSAGVPDTFTNQVYAYFAAVNESVRFGRR